jgi:hypothetical protein
MIGLEQAKREKKDHLNKDYSIENYAFSKLEN